MSKNENEARIYTGGRESARIFLRASSSHYTTIRMYGAVEKCGKQHMKGMQYQNKHVIKLSVRLQLEQPQHLDVLLLSTQLWPQTANVQRLQCESVRAVPGWCDHTEAAVAFLLENSNFIYKYACRCERTYVGETCQRFSERIKQHIPDKLYKKPPDKRVATSDSAITKHLQAQPECIPQERNSSFSVITPARNSAHRFTLEALYIRSLRPELCRQKKHIKVLRLFKLQPD